MTIRTQLYFAFVACAASVLIVGGFSIHSLSATSGSLSRTIDTEWTEVNYSCAAAEATETLDSLVGGFAYDVNRGRTVDLPAVDHAVMVNFDRISTAIAKLRAEATAALHNSRNQEEVRQENEHISHLDELDNSHAKLVANWQQIRADFETTGRLRDEHIRMNDVENHRLMVTALDLQQSARVEIVDAFNETVGTVRRQWTIVVFVGMTALTLIGAVAYTAARPLARRLRDVRAKASLLGEGDLTARLDVCGEDEISELAATFNHMAGSFQERTRELRASEERSRLLSKATNDAIWDWDFPSNRLDWSEGFEILFGFSPKEVETTIESWTNRIHPDDHARVFTKVHDIIANGGESFVDEYRFLCKDGHYAYVLDRGYIIRDAAGNVIRLVGAMTDLSERKKAEILREQLSSQLQNASRLAGKAEVATGVLHNVGNVLNSVNISATIVQEKIRESRTGGLRKVVAMLKEHETDLADFITRDDKGRQIPAYLSKLAEHVESEQKEMLAELDSLGKNLEHVKQIVSAQQSHATAASIVEFVDLADIANDAIRINLASIERHNIVIERRFDSVPPVMIDKHKVLQILVNLLSNAKWAVSGSAVEKRITIAITLRGNQPRITVTDTGVGIAADDMLSLFGHGFTRRKDGHGFGLHSASLDANAMGGAIEVLSAGLGKGASFTLVLASISAETPKVAA